MFRQALTNHFRLAALKRQPIAQARAFAKRGKRSQVQAAKPTSPPLKENPEQIMQRKVKQTMGSQQEYSVTQDKRLKNVGKDIGIVLLVVAVTGMLSKYTMDYLMNSSVGKSIDHRISDKVSRAKEIQAQVEGDDLKPKSIFKSPSEIENEFQFTKAIPPASLKNPSFFSKNKSFFIQIVPDADFLGRALDLPQAEIEQMDERLMEMHPHYYWLKKAVRKNHKSHMFSYKLRASDFRTPENAAIIRDVFHVESYEELNDLFYIAVNQDRIKMPIGGRLSGDQQSVNVPMKFMMNPLRVGSQDEMFDLLEGNKGMPIKYFVILNENNQKVPGKEMSLSQKMFRKFFYENSSYIETETVFVELTDPSLAKEVFGLDSTHQMACVQNVNPFSSLDSSLFSSGQEKATKTKLFNLDLEYVKGPVIKAMDYEGKIVKKLMAGGLQGEITTQLVEEGVLEDPDATASAFGKVASFVQELLLSQKVFIQTLHMLKFYRNYIREMANSGGNTPADGVLFVGLSQPTSMSSKDKFRELHLLNSKLNDMLATFDKQDLQVLLTDLNTAPQGFSFIADEASEKAIGEDEGSLLLPAQELAPFLDSESKAEGSKHMQSKLTVRYLDYSSLFDSKAKLSYSLKSDEDRKTMSEMPDERQAHIFSLKFKPEQPITSLADLEAFIEKCQMRQVKPHLESEAPTTDSVVPRLNVQNWEGLLAQKPYTIIEVFASQCSGCQKVEPLLPVIEDKINEKVKGVQVVQSHLLNELPFLTDINRTPTFLIYDRRRRAFKQVSFEGDFEGQQLEDIISDLVVDAIKA